MLNWVVVVTEDINTITHPVRNTSVISQFQSSVMKL
jgi:hypothetical protein